jgi:serine/threonine protein kinase
MELCVFIASRVARGLSHAHSRLGRGGAPLNIVHRDVCPNNIMITTEGLPKLADFGIAIVSSDLMHEGQLMGKLGYMSPQQALRHPVDYRADMFSLGASLFEMITLKKIRTCDVEGDFEKLAKKGVVDWDLLPKDLPDDIRVILEKCLAFDPDGRFQSSSELAKSLEYFIYKDGYGPTIQTLEAYLRSQMPYLYNIRRSQPTSSSAGEIEHAPITALNNNSEED